MVLHYPAVALIFGHPLVTCYRQSKSSGLAAWHGRSLLSADHSSNFEPVQMNAIDAGLLSIARQETNSIRDDLIRRLETRTATIGVLGLGYVGLPLILRYAAAGFRVLGFDVDTHPVGDDLHLVHQSDIDGSVNVLQQLGHLRRLG